MFRSTLPTHASWQPETLRYVDRKEVAASYWKNGRMSPGLLRARRQFRTKNAFAGIVLLVFVVGVFTYSIAAVKQDVFDDLDEEVKERAVLEAKRTALSVEDEKRAMAAAAKAATVSLTAKLPVDSSNSRIPTPQQQQQPQGVLTQPRGVLTAVLDARYPRLLDPTRKTLVWGAPPVDSIGRLGDRL
ncbi:Coiled-coil-56 domain-containing protein [Mycena indigotica]|uniref:Cytochrome c oxidase assembly factor 3 n=1 Tax=Mycena indigotica TaxID=2126181 RepID=A0A8H6VX09_9AGAR|nr:Coiled-coil-56 domain-containing protein [Mycena indigotica]KAF7297194.1 Coiled-coil-56 domain-containing protein [Mycena indigotica]